MNFFELRFIANKHKFSFVGVETEVEIFALRMENIENIFGFSNEVD